MRLTFDEAKDLICRIDPDSKDPAVQGVIADVCKLADVLDAYFGFLERLKARLDRIEAKLDGASAGVSESNALIRAKFRPEA